MNVGNKIAQNVYMADIEKNEVSEQAWEKYNSLSWENLRLNYSYIKENLDDYNNLIDKITGLAVRQSKRQ